MSYDAIRASRCRKAAMRRGSWLAVLLLGVLLTLPTVAHASPTDPVWIPGFYDDNDYDDVILLITGAVSVVDSRVVDPVSTVVVFLWLFAPGNLQPASPRTTEVSSTSVSTL